MARVRLLQWSTRRVFTRQNEHLGPRYPGQVPARQHCLPRPSNLCIGRGCGNGVFTGIIKWMRATICFLSVIVKWMVNHGFHSTTVKTNIAHLMGRNALLRAGKQRNQFSHQLRRVHAIAVSMLLSMTIFCSCHSAHAQTHPVKKNPALTPPRSLSKPFAAALARERELVRVPVPPIGVAVVVGIKSQIRHERSRAPCRGGRDR